ncbi:AI-2E family transporter [Paenibacillus doosanensis]|uniref:Pheromone autoinducer 2 transporter n=1 Tax=Paenibacillus konkukensis TaxID=2020716 RepID=A0ABY4RE13_9BACL|nr:MULTISPECIES: AI-2E family transporter [Paenibacillus]MCS7462342.1 AI-2E family transporter [Paenibacillus doosanensis]UQZ80847.1 pheromone autoinducer 2 transporter [Paenibacillus konkukensis]
MRNSGVWAERFKSLMFRNQFVFFLLILLLIGLNILVLTKVNFIFRPFLVLVKTVLLPIILSGIMYYLLNPVVAYLESKKVRRVYSIIVLYLLILGILALIIVTVIPLIRQQILSLVENLPAYSEVIKLQFEQLMGMKLINQLAQAINYNSDDLINSISQRASSMLNHTWSSLSGFLGALTETILAIVTVPFILFYLLIDGKRLPPYILQFVPIVIRDQTFRVMKEMSHQISSYIRGQIIVSFCIGFLLFIGYQVIGLDYSLVLAVMAACTSIVPYLGPAIAITPALIVASVTSPVMLLKMIAIWTIVQLIEGKFISPQIMGKTLHIHPVTIIFVILTAGNLFGIAGIILAVPGYAVLKVIVTHLFLWFKSRSGLYEAPK